MIEWQVGDLAVYVDNRDALTGKISPVASFEIGHVTRVTAVFAVGSTPMLYVEGGKNVNGYRASRFRKIHPDEHQACEPEFVMLLRRSKVKINA